MPACCFCSRSATNTSQLDAAEMELQVCHSCGWSKVTTYQGLRTHQGKMGCTPKGVRVSDPPQHYTQSYVGHTKTQMDLRVDVRTSFKIETETTEYSNVSLQVCHCGWNKLTTYQGLRIHQGKMGCTPKGVRIPKKEQYNWKNQWEEDTEYWKPAKKATVKEENFPESPSVYGYANSGATAIFKEEYKLTASAYTQHYSQRSRKSHHQLQEHSTLPQVSRPAREPSAPSYPGNAVRPKEKKVKQKTLSQIENSSTMAEYLSVDLYRDYATTATKIKQEPKSPLRTTPQSSFQRASRRLPQEFSPGVEIQRSVPPTPPPREQAVLPVKNDSREQTQVSRPAREPSAPPYPGNIVRPKKKKVKQQTFSQTEDSSELAGYLSTDCSADYPTTATKIKEEPKSPLATPQPSFQRATSVRQQEVPLEAAVMLKNQERKNQTQNSPGPAKTSSSNSSAATFREDEYDSASAQRSTQRANNSKSDHQLYEFSSLPQVTAPAREPSAPPCPGNVIQSKEEKIKQQPLSHAVDSNAVTGYLNIDPSADYATIAVKIKEKPKSPPATSQPSFQRATSDQQQEFSTGLKVRRSVREPPSTREPETAELIEKKETNDQRQVMSPATTNPAPAGQAEENHTQNQTFSQVSKSARDHPTTKPPVPPKKKNSALFKERLERFKAELQPKLQMTEGKNCEVRACRPESIPNVTSANTQTSPAAADVSPKDNPTQLDHAAEAELSTGVKVKELARMFSAKETLISTKEKHGANQKPSQVKLLAQRFSTISAQETAAKAKEEQKPIQMVTDSKSNPIKINSAAAKASLTAEKDPKLSCENAPLSDFSSGLKVKDLARMFSANTTQEKTIGLKEKRREEQKPANGVKLLIQKLSARETKDHQKEKDTDTKDRNHSKWI
ncbi:nucleolar and coiled-body phosphoprotein 1-like isoform X4 [Oreochromis aureus]|uniref:nucleolar and coiled-body phosphoprotein 1-like isoform X4 n=1 Tax=Oreochromis aureus TaxID=47969 RepID=UPI0012BBAC99|nr:nucleolar and coiled-body phosphoprotein 1-like isoform X4 [Oreochromis aureus]